MGKLSQDFDNCFSSSGTCLLYIAGLRSLGVLLGEIVYSGQLEKNRIRIFDDTLGISGVLTSIEDPFGVLRLRVHCTVKFLHATSCSTLPAWFVQDHAT